MQPEPEDLPGILKKIQAGLPDPAPARPAADGGANKAGGG